MASIYEQSITDKVLVLEPREALQRKFDVGAWNEIRIGLYWNDCGLGTIPTASYSTETVNFATYADALTIGLKDSATTILPGFSGSYFIGLASTGSNNVKVSGPISYSSRYESQTSSNLYGAGFYGTSSYFGGQNLSYMDAYNSAQTNYCGIYVLRMVLNNSGSASQTISMYSFMENNASVTSTNYYSSYNLGAAMQPSSWSTVSTVTWNNGAIAYPIPDSLWIRTPFYNNRMRISAVKISKYS